MTNPDDYMIELINVRKRYNQRLALDGVSLRIGQGVTGLLGPNGSGKSTLIKSLMGLVKTESGSGQVLGRKWPAASREIRDLVGYLPEDDCYFAGLQGVETVQLAGRLSGLTSFESLRRAHEVLDFCDVGQERYRTVETYSTGMRQKLKFAQTLIHDPPLIILDEPTTGLDPTQRDGLLNRIKVLAEQHHKTILLSTHILTDVRQICDSVIILAGGTVRVAAKLEDLSRPTEPGLTLGFHSGQREFVDYVRRIGVQIIESKSFVHLKNLTDEQTVDVWTWAAASGASIRNLEPSRTSLEQIFIDAVREADPQLNEITLPEILDANS